MPSECILVVDDDAAVNALNCEILQESGFRALGVHCAATAFDTIDNGAGLSALVTDVELGHGPDGFAVARRARITNPEIPVLYVSGTAAARYRSEGVERSEFLQKPFRPSEFVAALRRVLRHQTASSDIAAGEFNQESASLKADVLAMPDSSV